MLGINKIWTTGFGGQMPASISIYIYRVRLFEVNGRAALDFDDARLPGSMESFFQSFVTKHAALKEDHERQRTWFFDPPKHAKNGEISGYLRYGTFGFESEIYDTKSKKKQYDRKSTDFEQVELYYQFWSPEGVDFALIAFQTFSGRSCISYVNYALSEEFKKTHKGLTLRIDKIAPQNIARSTFANSEVKQVTMVKRSSSSDLANLHGASKRPDEVEVEVKVTAKSGSFGKFGSFNPVQLKSSAGIFAIGSTPFQKATALVELNGKMRRIGVFGNTGNAGAFDVTEEVDFGPNGHPTYKSIDSLADDILSDVHSALT